MAEQISDEEIQKPEENEAKPQKARVNWEKVIRRTVLSLGFGFLAVVAALAIPYYKLSKRVDQNLAVGPFEHTFNYYSAPESFSPGDPITPADFAAEVKRTGTKFALAGNSVTVDGAGPVEIQFANDRVSAIIDLTNHRKVHEYQLPAQLIANMSDEGRAKRTMVRYADLPPVLIKAIISAEDKRFFKHGGFDVPRMGAAFYVDVKQQRKEQGASTISMQLARNLWLDHDKNWRRKIAEALITLHLESRLSKQQIMQDYCNTVYLGSNGTFSIDGMGEASRAYFDKDVTQLNLTQAATLAGLIQRPSYFNPYRHPERALERRNVVLSLMRRNGYISRAQYDAAVAAPLGLRKGITEQDQSQYFFDLASDEAAKNAGELQTTGPAEVHTTIDLRLQRAAEHAIAAGIPVIDKELGVSRKHIAAPQAALIVLDPHTGEVKALCGGRDYASSQFNRILSKRPPGSVFKPFVYAAALNTALTGGNTVFTPLSTVDDSPTTFQYDRGLIYSPANFKDQYHGMVTLRQALAHSLNVATVKVGEQVGFNNVVALARAAGINDDIRPTPALALGAYQVTPLEIAEAYTIFANDGVRVKPIFVTSVSDQSGTGLYDHQPGTQRVLDQRVAFLMVDMLQEVMRSGTAAGVHALGFNLPAAGKTGTSHDGWFAGFTSQLLCIVWVGYDDYHELGLEGAKSALPIWTEFMKEAASYAQYGNARPFPAPGGVVRAAVDLQTGHLASPDCTANAAYSYFIDGTQPAPEQCAPTEVELISTPDGGVAERQARPPRPDQNQF
ncbi:MAG TPA: PBP1A family penicillin-binding protein [Bryobacteraceae bacterium]|nr:PBP1A family penicillin-binding protein [Bryobacteraceae bacterium]